MTIPATVTGFTLDLVDHNFLETWEPTTEPQTLPLGKFKGCEDARYDERPTVAAHLGRALRAEYAKAYAENRTRIDAFWVETWGIGFDIGDAQYRFFVEAKHWPAGHGDDGAQEVTIRTVTPEALETETTKANATT